MELYVGLDLHSRNTYIGIMDNDFKRVFKKRVPNHLELILQTLAPFRDKIKGFVVESTFNWYWLTLLWITDIAVRGVSLSGNFYEGL